MKNISMPKYPQVHIHLHKYIHGEPHIYIHIRTQTHSNTDAHKCSLDTHRVRAGVARAQSHSNPSSLRVPESAARAVARPPLGPRSASGTAGVGLVVHSSPALGWAGPAAGPRPGPGRAQRGGPEPAPLAPAPGPVTSVGRRSPDRPWPQ